MDYARSAIFDPILHARSVSLFAFDVVDGMELASSSRVFVFVYGVFGGGNSRRYLKAPQKSGEEANPLLQFLISEYC